MINIAADVSDGLATLEADHQDVIARLVQQYGVLLQVSRFLLSRICVKCFPTVLRYLPNLNLRASRRIWSNIYGLDQRSAPTRRMLIWKR